MREQDEEQKERNVKMTNEKIQCEIIEVTALMKGEDKNHIKEVYVAFWGSNEASCFVYQKNIYTEKRVQTHLTEEERSVLMERLAAVDTEKISRATGRAVKKVRTTEREER